MSCGLCWRVIPILILICLSGCLLDERTRAAETPPTATPSVIGTTPPNTAMTFACVYPAGWQAYTVQPEETAAQIAARAGISLEELLQGNCLLTGAIVTVGSRIYIPPQNRFPAMGQLPLGISFFDVQPRQAAPGDRISITWQGQGNIRSVRLGTVFENQFIEAADDLPVSGMLELTVADEGRATLQFMLIVSDGVYEAVAQTGIQIECREAWFFAPAPTTCPTAPLVTTFHQQTFERGTILYVPALGMHYVLVAGQETQLVEDHYVPGMTLPAIDLPADRYASLGAIGYLWQYGNIQNALGYAITPEAIYTGTLQRAVTPHTDMTYLLASSGHVYQVGVGWVWGVIIPQD